jgi:hypothetical protein
LPQMMNLEERMLGHLMKLKTSQLQKMLRGRLHSSDKINYEYISINMALVIN